MSQVTRPRRRNSRIKMWRTRAWVTAFMRISIASAMPSCREGCRFIGPFFDGGPGGLFTWGCWVYALGWIGYRPKKTF